MRLSDASLRCKSRAFPAHAGLAAEKGFTLVELVCVIIILSVLAAVAMPRFVGLSQQARVAAVKTLLATVQAAANSVHAACLTGMSGCDASLQNGVATFSGQTLQLNYGWPDAGDNLGTFQIDTMITATGVTATTPNSSTTRFSFDSAPDPAHCAVSYVDAYTRGAALGIDITTDTSGC